MTNDYIYGQQTTRKNLCLFNKLTHFSLYLVKYLLFREAEGHSDAISGVAFTHDNRYIASCSNDTSWRLWSIQPCHERSVIVQESAHDLGIQSVDFSPEVLNLEEDNTIR